MTEPCYHCTQATLGPWHGQHANCKGCDARALSRGPHFFASRRENKLTPEYRQALERLKLTHDDVKAAAEQDKLREVA